MGCKTENSSPAVLRRSAPPLLKRWPASCPGRLRDSSVTQHDTHTSRQVLPGPTVTPPTRTLPVWDPRPGPLFLTSTWAPGRSTTPRQGPNEERTVATLGHAGSCVKHWWPRDHPGLQEPCLIFPSEAVGLAQARGHGRRAAEQARQSRPGQPCSLVCCVLGKGTGRLISTHLTAVS